jgi:hypothetical protein
MKRDNLKLTGRVQVHKNGELVADVPNLVVDTGLAFIASRMKDATATAMSHMAIGSDNTAANASDTALASELGRVALTSTTPTDNDIVYVATFPAGTGTGTVVEAGLLNAGSGGTLLARTVLSAISKGASDSITITWTITIS